MIDLLNRMGSLEAAEEASRVLAESMDPQQLKEFGDRHGIPHSELVSQMAGTL